MRVTRTTTPVQYFIDSCLMISEQGIYMNNYQLNKCFICFFSPNTTHHWEKLFRGKGTCNTQ